MGRPRRDWTIRSVTHESERGVRIRLFDADRTDRALSLEDALDFKVSERQLLWIDIEGNLDGEQRRALVARFELDSATDRDLAHPGRGPHVQLHGTHFHLRVAAEPDAGHPEETSWLEIVAGDNVLISRHDRPLEFLRAMHERIAADATIGDLGSTEFVASVLDAIVTTYHAAVDALENELDEIDTQALSRPNPKALFARLVGVRRRVGRLRRLLASHRELFGALAGPDFVRGIETENPEMFLPVAKRFEGAIASLESTREAVLGSFEILMTRTAQRTNDVMRVLTLVTVMAVPATVTAGFLGMNVIVPVPNDDPASFWIIGGLVLLFEATVFAIARWRGWV
jgi:Mg2+ and Co2+ transporter CorA